MVISSKTDITEVDKPEIKLTLLKIILPQMVVPIRAENLS